MPFVIQIIHIPLHLPKLILALKKFCLPALTQNRYTIVSSFAAISFFLMALQLRGQNFNDNNIKAAFLYNFTHFIEWPVNAFTTAEAPLVIGILGIDPFNSLLDKKVSNETIKGRSIKVERYTDVRDIKTCHLLFISHSEIAKRKEIFDCLLNKNIVTVSDIPDFVTNGGMIGFVSKQSKIILQINLSASKAADIQISSKLLQMAEIVR